MSWSANLHFLLKNETQTYEINSKVLQLELELKHGKFDKYKYTTYITRGMWLKKLYQHSRETNW